jgi:hypothetical protein
MMDCGTANEAMAKNEITDSLGTCMGSPHFLEKRYGEVRA